MNIENLQESELWALHFQLSEKLGFFCLDAITVKDIKSEIESRIEEGEESRQLPSDENIRRACRVFWRTYTPNFLDNVHDVCSLAFEYEEKGN